MTSPGVMSSGRDFLYGEFPMPGTIEYIATAVLVIGTAVFVVWVLRVTKQKRLISHKPIQSTTIVGTTDHHGRYYEIEVQTGLMNIVGELIAPDVPGPLPSSTKSVAVVSEIRNPEVCDALEASEP